MDDISRAYYQLHLKNTLLEAFGSDFEHFFQRVMKSIHHEDFVNVIPSGNQGDQKCDGYLRSERTLFQVYGPARPIQSKLLNKMKDDFEGAVKHWDDHFDTWVFVYKHHFDDGLPPEVLKLVLQLKEKSSKNIIIWLRNEVIQLFDQLDDNSLSDWFGPMPSNQTTFGFEELEPLFQHLTHYETEMLADISPITGDKIAANLFDQATINIIKNSLPKVNKIERYLEVCSDAELGERAKTAFSEHYQHLKSQQLDANAIFFAFEQWLAKGQFFPPKKRQAIDALITHFFEKCDIFEPPRG